MPRTACSCRYGCAAMGPELARGHVLDHALTKRTDGGICAHGELLLSEVAKTSIFPQDGAPHPAFVSSQLAAKPSIAHPAQRAIAQRFSAVALLRPLRRRANSRELGLLRGGLRTFERNSPWGSPSTTRSQPRKLGPPWFAALSVSVI